MASIFYGTVIYHSLAERFRGWIRGEKIPRKTVIEDDPPKTLGEIVRGMEGAAAREHPELLAILNEPNHLFDAELRTEVAVSKPFRYDPEKKTYRTRVDFTVKLVIDKGFRRRVKRISSL